MNRKIFCVIVTGILISVMAANLSAATNKPAAVVEVQSVSKLVTDISCVAGALSFPFQSENITKALESLMHSPNLAGVNTNKPFSIYLFLPSDPSSDMPPSVAVSLSPAGDAKSYLNAVGGAFKRLDKVKDVNHFSEPQPAIPGKQNDIYVAFAKEQAIIGDEAVVVQTVTELIRNGADNVPLRSVHGTIRVAINIESILPWIEEHMRDISARMPQTPAAMGQGGNVDPKKILEVETDALVAILRQVRTIAVGCGADTKSIGLQTSLSAIPTTTLGKLIQDAKPPSDKYLSVLPNNALLAICGGGMNALDSLIEPYCDLMSKLSPFSGSDSTNLINKMRASMMSMKGFYSGDLAIAVVPQDGNKGIGLIEIIAVKDPVKVGKFMDDTFASYNETYGKSSGAKLSIGNQRTYKNAKISSYAYSITPAGMGAFQGPVPFSGLLSNLRGEWTFVGNDLIYTLGTGSIMNVAIDCLTAPGSRLDKSKMFTDLFPKTDEKPLKLGTLALVKLAKTVLLSMPNISPQMLAGFPESGGGIACRSFKKGEDLTSDTRISLTEIAAIRDAAPMLGTLFMQTMMGGMAQGGAAQLPADQCISNLRLIDAAKEQYALEKNLKDGDKVGVGAIIKYLPGGKMPMCPGGGTYTLKNIGEPPACSIPGHALK